MKIKHRESQGEISNEAAALTYTVDPISLHDSTNLIRTTIDNINLDDKHKSKIGVNLKTTIATNMLIIRLYSIRLRLMIVSTKQCQGISL